MQVFFEIFLLSFCGRQKCEIFIQDEDGGLAQDGAGQKESAVFAIAQVYGPRIKEGRQL